MSKGYVYILSNTSMPGLVKIGKTTRPDACTGAMASALGWPCRNRGNRRTGAENHRRVGVNSMWKSIGELAKELVEKGRKK